MNTKDTKYQKTLEKYHQLLDAIKDRKREVNRLVEWLEEKTNWLDCPASTKFHLNIPGGLLIHSVGVAEMLLRIRDCIAPQYSDETCVIVGLFHDVGKVGDENAPLYIPNSDKKSHGEKPFVRNPEIVEMGLGVRSLYIMSRFVPLSPEEAQAICYHDGQYIPENKVVALKEKPLLLMLHFADLWTAQVTENE